ncbi:hypothetical protein [Rugosimonospora africana]|uniref:Uncharacterized protein n=1 Tax=Rugosimonospora africana TaxID=556532 RepID=A0A8J3QL78_9ACTN|nr:hypothetical protein [Rugosimonospora africana]GIH11869.1 hypothetical protein Raf01_00410 [Rugosimonospora africana]
MSWLNRRWIYRRELRHALAEEFVIGEPTVGDGRLSTTVRFGAERWDVWFAGDDLAVDAAGDAFATALLLPAMRRARRLRIEAPVSARLLDNLAVVQSTVHSWDPRYRPVTVDAAEVAGGGRAPAPRPAAAFFSGGVDSCYTAVRQEDRVEALVFLNGFDVAHWDVKMGPSIRDGVASAAKALGKPLIVLDTNIRDPLESVAPWTALHGGVLAAAAHLLSNRYATFYLPATFWCAALQPHGSHPVLDPWWGNDSVALVHDGAERHRPGKALVLAQRPELLRWLRVCWRNTEGRYNCGRCVKCLNTLTAFHEAGALPLLESFPPRRRPELLGAELRWRKLRSNEERNPAFGPRSAGTNHPDWGTRRTGTVS